MSNQKTIALLFHGLGCPDGYTAAWTANQMLRDRADYLPINYGESLYQKYPHIRQYNEIYIVDFSFDAATLQELAADRRVVVLDHHETAKNALENLTLPNKGEIYFDMGRSGAAMTWDYFFSEKTRPKLIDYVQDRDLWTWLLPHSRDVSAALALEELNFEAWSDFADRLQSPREFDKIVAAGVAVNKYIQQKIDRIITQVRIDTIGGHIVPVVNSSILESEVGERLNQMYPDHPFAAIWYQTKDGKKKFSLRGFKVNEVARKYGGGGHAAAAGFTLTME